MEHLRNMNLTSPHGLVLMVSKQEKPHPPNAFPILEVWNLYKFQINRREQWHHFSVCKSVSCNKNLTLSSTFTCIYLLKKKGNINSYNICSYHWSLVYPVFCWMCLVPMQSKANWQIKAMACGSVTVSKSSKTSFACDSNLSARSVPEIWKIWRWSMLVRCWWLFFCWMFVDVGSLNLKF